MFFFPSQSPLEPCSLSHEAQGKPCLYFILPVRGKISRGNFGKCCQCGNVASYQCCQFPIGEPVASGAAVAGRPPYPAARRDASPHHTAQRDACCPSGVARSHGRLGSGLKGSRMERMVEQLAEFKAWLRDNPVNERIAARTVGARASTYWRLHEKTFAKDATRTGDKRGFSSPKTLASAYRNSKA